MAISKRLEAAMKKYDGTEAGQASAKSYGRDAAYLRERANAAANSPGLAKNGYVSVADLNAETNQTTSPRLGGELGAARWTMADSARRLENQRRAMEPFAASAARREGDGTLRFGSSRDLEAFRSLQGAMEREAGRYTQAAEDAADVLRKERYGPLSGTMERLDVTMGPLSGTAMPSGWRNMPEVDEDTFYRGAKITADRAERALFQAKERSAVTGPEDPALIKAQQDYEWSQRQLQRVAPARDAMKARKRLLEYAPLLDEPDFAENSRYRSTYQPGTEEFNAWTGRYTSTGFGDIEYDYINGNETARSRKGVNDIQSNAALLGLDNSERREMTEDEIAIFNYLYATRSPEEAYQYIEALTADLNARSRMADQRWWSEYASENPVGSSALSLLMSPMKGLSYLGQTADYLADGKIDQNEGYNKFSYIPSTIRGQVSSDIEKNVEGFWGKAGSFAYQTGMSMGDFLLNTGITGGNQALTLSIMGSGAAADATISAKDRGLSDSQAYTLGTIAGLAEVVTEKVSLEALLKPDWEKGVLNYIIKNAVAEGSEEVASDAINLMSDILISKDKSEWAQSIQTYMDQGYSEAEATGLAVRDQALSMGLDFLGGAVSGGIMSGVSGASHVMTNYQSGRQLNSMDLSAEDIQAFVDEGLDSDPSTQAYKLATAAQQKVSNGETLTNYELGNLYQANIRAIDLEESEPDDADQDNPLMDAAREVTGETESEPARPEVRPLATVEPQTREAWLRDTFPVRPAVEESAPETHGQEASLLQKYADAFGESGRRAMLAAYAPEQNAGDFYAGFAAQYQAGLTGQDGANARTGNLTQAQQYAAYTAGQNDAAASLEAERQAARTRAENPGLVRNEQAAALPRRQTRFWDQLARDSGVHIEFVDRIADEAGNPSGGNGIYIPESNTIRLSLDADQPLLAVASHEITHHLQQTAPEDYRAYRDYANREISERLGTEAVEEAMRRYAAHGLELTMEQAMDEVAAEFAEAMANNGKLFESLVRENRSVAQKVLDAVKAFLEKVRRVFSGSKSAQNSEAMRVYGVDMDTLEQAARLWQQAYDAAGTAQGTENAANEGGETRYSLKTFEDGHRFVDVEADQERFDGLSEREMGRLATKIIREKFVGKVIGLDNRVFVKSRSASEYGFPVKHLDPDAHNAKMRASAELDNLMDAGTNFRMEPDGRDGHVHADAAGDFRYFDTTFKVGNQYYTGVINLLPTERGVVLKDVTQIRNITQAISGSYGENPQATILRDASMSSIPKNGGEVNTQFDAAGGKGRYSIKYDRDNTPYVEVENDILEGVPEDQWVKTVKENLRRKFPEGITVGNNVISINGQSQKEMTYSKYTRYLMQNDPALYADKLRATNNADEILKASQDWVNEALMHPRKDTIQEFARGSAQLRIGASDYTAQVVVAKRSDGKLLLYDILALSPTEIQAKEQKSDAAISKNPSPGTGRSTASGFDASIAQDDSEVNGKYSLREKSGPMAEELRTLQRENERLRERVEHFKGQLRQTRRATTDRKSVERAARQLAKDYGADVDTKALAGKLQSLYDYIAGGGDGKNELTYEEARRRAEDIGREIVENAVERDSEVYETYADLRRFLRGAKLTISEADSRDFPDFLDFRKQNFGRLNISRGETNIDQAYAELSQLWPEFFDEQAVSHPADQLRQMAGVLDGVYRITERNPFSGDLDRAASAVAGEILESFFDLPQTKPTFADKQARMRDDLRAELRRRADAAIGRERARREKQTSALKARYAARDAAGRERRSAGELRRRIARHAGALSQKLLRPTDRQHIPENLRTAVAAMLESINLESQYSVGEDGKRRKDADGAPTKRTEVFRKLKEQYAAIAREGGDLVIDPSLLGDDREGIQGGFDQVISMGDTRLADMNTSQLQTVWNVVRAVEHAISTAGKTLSEARFKETAEWADALRRDTEDRRGRRGNAWNKGKMDLETPYTFFSHFGDAGKAVYRMLRDAQDAQQSMVDAVAGEAKKVADSKTVRALERETNTFQTDDGAKLTLSKAQIMDLYLLSRREQGLGHLLKGGVVQPAVKGARIERGTESIRLTESDIQKITGALTPEEKKIADGLQALTAGLLSSYGNEASMRAYGYRKFTEQNYWPIRSARESLHSSVEKGENNARSIKNIGMAKNTVPHAGNPVDLGSVFDTFSRHASDMTDYAAWLAPMEDANRLFNFQFRDGDGNLTGKNIKGILDRVAGSGIAQKYWSRLMEDIQNGIQAPGDSALTNLAAKGIGAFKGAAVGGNIRVVLQQPTAFFRALAVLDPQDLGRGLARGVTKKSGWEKALQYAPIARRKDAGGFDISSPTQMRDTLFDQRSGLRKFNDGMGWAAGKADAVTWGKLWNACEWATAREHPGLEKGSDAFYRETARQFAEVIDQTQVVDGVLQRSNIMRSSNALAQQATSFMGEPIMSLNLLMRSWDAVRSEQDPKKRGRAIRTLGRAGAALVLTDVVNALAQSLVDAGRDDDPDKKYWERFWAAFSGLTGEEESAWEKALAIALEGNVGSNLNLIGQIPFAKDILSIFQGYSVNRTEMEVIEDLVDAGQLAADAARGGSKTPAYAAKEALVAGAKLFGIPASNLSRDIWGLARSIAVETDSIPAQYEMEKAIYSISHVRNSARYCDLLYRALELNDMTSYWHIRNDLMENMGLDGEKIDSALKSRYQKAIEKDPGRALDEKRRDLLGILPKYAPEDEDDDFTAKELGPDDYRAYTEQKAADYRETMDTLAGYDSFPTLDEESRDKLTSAAYKLAKSVALEDHSGGKYTLDQKWMQWAVGGGAAGVDEAEAILFKLAYDMSESERDEDGDVIPGSKKENTLEQAKEWMPWLTNGEMNYLMSYKWKPDKE